MSRRRPRVLQKVDDILCRDIAGRTSGIRAAAETADRAVERAQAEIQGRLDVGDSHALGVMEVTGEGRNG